MSLNNLLWFALWYFGTFPQIPNCILSHLFWEMSLHSRHFPFFFFFLKITTSILKYIQSAVLLSNLVYWTRNSKLLKIFFLKEFETKSCWTIIWGSLVKSIIETFFFFAWGINFERTCNLDHFFINHLVHICSYVSLQCLSANIGYWLNVCFHSCKRLLTRNWFVDFWNAS